VTIPTPLARVQRRFVTPGYLLRNPQMSAPGSSSDEVLQPKQLGDFRIIREVGHGGSYLKATGLRTGLLLKFNALTLVIKRMVL
jgi:hypothetical protein